MKRMPTTLTPSSERIRGRHDSAISCRFQRGSDQIMTSSRSNVRAFDGDKTCLAVSCAVLAASADDHEARAVMHRSAVRACRYMYIHSCTQSLVAHRGLGFACIADLQGFLAHAQCQIDGAMAHKSAKFVDQNWSLGTLWHFKLESCALYSVWLGNAYRP